MKRRAWGCAANIAGGNGTSAKLGGERSQRAQRRAVRLRCSAWPQNAHPTLEKVVGGLVTAVGAGTLHWWGRFLMFPPQGAAQIARRRAAARSVRMTRPLWPSDLPPLKSFFFVRRHYKSFMPFFRFHTHFCHVEYFCHTQLGR
jgi:hypothetical protein